jgi:hypothetical protein
MLRRVSKAIPWCSGALYPSIVIFFTGQVTSFFLLLTLPLVHGTEITTSIYKGLLRVVSIALS